MKFRNPFKYPGYSEQEDPIVVSFHDSVLRSGDIATLEEGQWLNDAVIGYFFTHLEHNLANLDKLKIVFLQPSMVHLLRFSSDPSSLVGVLPNNLVESNYIFIPVNDHASNSVGGNHWSLLVYSKPNNGSFFYYDSLNNYNFIHAKHTSLRFIEFLKLSAGTIRAMPTPYQTNGNDCGVYVTSLSETLATLLTTSTAMTYLNDSRQIMPTLPDYLWNVQESALYPPHMQRIRIKESINRLSRK